VSYDPDAVDTDADYPLPPPHPAKFTAKHLNSVIEILGDNPKLLILDPFAGIGTIHDLPYMTTGIEIEPEWAYQRVGTAVGSALNTGYEDEYFDAVVTSPCFGNRMADHHNAKDGSKRHTYRHYLGRELTKGSAATMQWGEEYKHFHTEAWLEAKKILKVGGLLIINIKDHIREGKIQHVTQWHADACSKVGFNQIDTIIIPVSGMTHGENAEQRIPHESLLVFQKPEKNTG
jgi:DNA modification methylase